MIRWLVWHSDECGYSKVTSRHRFKTVARFYAWRDNGAISERINP